MDVATKCPLCAIKPAHKIFDKGGISYYRCLTCNFVFSQAERNPNFTSTIDDYQPSYLQYLDISIEDDRNHAALLKWIKRFHSVEGKQLLDVGAGSGKLVRFLRTNGVDAHGIEPAAPLFAKFLASESWFSQKTIEEFENVSTRGALDIVLACDVIEHVDRPDILLQKASNLLRHGGLLLVSTPDVGSIFARLSGKRWHYYNEYHLSYLTRTSIGQLAKKVGLREVGFARLPRLKSVGYLFQYLMNFVLGTERISTPQWLNKIVIPVNLFDTMYVAFEKTSYESVSGPTRS